MAFGWSRILRCLLFGVLEVLILIDTDPNRLCSLYDEVLSVERLSDSSLDLFMLNEPSENMEFDLSEALSFSLLPILALLPLLLEIRELVFPIPAQKVCQVGKIVLLLFLIYNSGVERGA